MNKLLDRIFPLRKMRNVSMFYVLSAVYNAWFMAGVWVFIWGMFMTKTQIGISDSITFTIGFLVELPSGVFADLIGRKKAIVIGNILLTIGSLFVGLSSSFVGITGWYLVWTIGFAFQSGATEAHVYDTIKQQGLENEWHAVISTSTVIGKIATLLCTALGGYLFIFGFRLPYMAAAITGSIGIIAALSLQEIVIRRKANLWSLKAYLDQIKDGIHILFKPNIIPLSLLSLVILGIGYMYNWGLLRPLTSQRFGFTPTTYSLLLAATSFIVIISIISLRWLQKKIKIEILLFSIGFLYAFLFLVMGLPHAWVTGGLLTIGLAIALTYIDILFSQYINLHTDEKHRATTLSAVALFTKLPYVLLALIIGRIAEKNQLPQYTIIVGVIALALWMVSLFVFTKGVNKKILKTT